MSGAATLTPYEIKRDERVARNKAILAKLIANNPLHQQMMMMTTTKKKKKKKRLDSIWQPDSRCRQCLPHSTRPIAGLM